DPSGEVLPVRNAFTTGGGTHLPCGLQYQGWPAGALSNQKLTPAISHHLRLIAGGVFKEWPDLQSVPWCIAPVPGILCCCSSAYLLLPTSALLLTISCLTLACQTILLPDPLYRAALSY
ncbi:unnamed protein product, partial [Staurois parvus]